MKRLKEDEGGATGPSGVTQASNVGSGKTRKVDTFGIKRKPVNNSEIFYEQLWELDDYKE